MSPMDKRINQHYYYNPQTVTKSKLTRHTSVLVAKNTTQTQSRQAFLTDDAFTRLNVHSPDALLMYLFITGAGKIKYLH